ncbi:MAG: Gfo/Idh/MocA family oxidoreductase [Gemmatimonadetes bacterium]|nr:Gfo/Idh/MocA family oxidoreductase [Gemmatimonadota bacterium]
MNSAGSSAPSRRQFVADSAKLAMGAAIVPRHVLGGPGYQAPSDTLNIAIVGVGGQGTGDALELGSERITAVCDPDFGIVDRRVIEHLTDQDGEPREEGYRWQEQYRDARRYTDFRLLLERERDIDAVVIATPDHLHAPIAKAAMEEGKHVYVEKPLTYTVHESRVLARVARETGVVTQMGNQGHSGDDAHRINEWIEAGILGPVREVHIWTNRPIWPQGVLRPQPWNDGLNPGWYQQWHQGAISGMTAEMMYTGYGRSPDMDWSLYLGPVAKDVPYHPIYHPFNWRGWVDFGVSALGDMGAHLVDHPFWALDLGYPTTVEATSTPWGGPAEDPDSYPLAMTAHYRFPARNGRPPVAMSWYDGGLMPPRPEALPDDVELDRTGGVLFVGEQGILMHETYGRNPQIFPDNVRERADAVPETHARIESNHRMNWANACKGLEEASSPFSYAARLTEVMLLGVVALRTGQGRRIEYDGEAMRITNITEANEYLTREYREGWEVS